MAEMLGGTSTTTKVTSTTQQVQSSSTVAISNENDFYPLLKDLEDEKKSEVEWILLEPQADKTVKYVTYGSGLFTGAPPQGLANLIEDKKVQYLLVTIPQGTRQLALFRWIGKDAPKDVLDTSEIQNLPLVKLITSKLHHGNELKSGELRG